MDLLPLYHDGVCNKSSAALVEEHLKECEKCKDMLEKIKNNTVDNYLVKVRDDVVKHHTQAVRRKSRIMGLIIAAVISVPVVVSFIVNLAASRGALSWFFIVLTSIMMVASLTVVPLVVEKYKGLRTLGSFAASLTLLLLVCAIYSGGDWFFVSIIPSIFGLSVIFAPFVLNQLPLKGFASRHKGLLAMGMNTLLLFAVVIVSGLYGGHVSADFWLLALQSTISALLLPWGLFLIIRYLKTNGLIRAGLSVIFGALYISVINTIIEWFVTGEAWFRFTGANLLKWDSYTQINANVYLLILITGLVTGVALLAFGIKRRSC
jgi:hypothetical protein